MARVLFTLAKSSLIGMTDMIGSIRKVKRSDLELILNWRNDPSIRKWMRTQDIIAPEDHLSWFLKLDSDPQQDFFLYEEDGVALGFCKILFGINNEIEWGFYIGPKSPKGVGKRFGRCVIDYIFNCYKAEVLIGNVKEFNKRSCLFHERFGFKSDSRFGDGYFNYRLTRQNWLMLIEEVSS